MPVSALMRTSKQFVCMGHLRLSIPIRARSLHPMPLLQQLLHPEQDSAWMEKVLGLTTLYRAFLALTEIRRSLLEGLRHGSRCKTVDLQIHREIQHDPTTLIIRRQNTKQDSLISTSSGTAQGIIGRPANTLIFEQNLSHKPEPSYRSPM